MIVTLQLYRTTLESQAGLPHTSIPSTYTPVIWRPSPSRFWPSGFPVRKGMLNWLSHTAHVFQGRDFMMFCLYSGSELASWLIFVPRFFRFPFMQPEDIFVTDNYTAPEHRNRGLSTHMFARGMESLQKPERRFWGITEDSNLPMDRVLKKCGFQVVGTVERRACAGIELLGRYEPIGSIAE